MSALFRVLAAGLAALIFACAGGALAQSTPDLVGVANGDAATGGQLVFGCSGSPGCTGQFVFTGQEDGCSNAVTSAGAIQLTVPDISVAGPVSGSGTLVDTTHTQRNADGSCSGVTVPPENLAITFSGTSDGVVATVTYTITDPQAGSHLFTGTLVRASAAYGSVKVSGSGGGPTPEGGQVAITFTCVGSPLCTGTYSGSMRDGGCSNAFPVSGTVSFTGFDLASASFAGNAVLQNINVHDNPNPDGTCSVKSADDQSVTYTASFDGSGGSITLNGSNGQGVAFSIPGTFSVTGIGGGPSPASTPPFTITTQSSITATSASATAHIQPPAQDVGKNVSIYVFAFAPRSLVKSLRRTKDDTGGCVLAQLDPQTGQLRAASASSLSPALSGTLSAQGQSVTILNNASTPAIAGASFFVGYGGDSSTMISDGVNANAVQVPGSQQCPSVFPKTPGSLSGLWYAGEQESGWGIDFTQRGANVFAAFYTYGATGQPKWYVASACAMAASALTSGRCSGDLYEVTASPLFGTAAGGSPNAAVKAGSLQVDFTDAAHATMSYTVGSVSRSVAIQRDVFASGAVPPTIDYTDIWYDSQASGWGMAIAQQYSVMFLAWYVYDAGGKPVWYVASDCAAVASGNGCTGPLYQVTGPPFGPTFDRTQVHVAPVGSVGVTFTDPNSGTISYTVNGATSSKNIVRYVF